MHFLVIQITSSILEKTVVRRTLTLHSDVFCITRYWTDRRVRPWRPWRAGCARHRRGRRPAVPAAASEGSGRRLGGDGHTGRRRRRRVNEMKTRERDALFHDVHPYIRKHYVDTVLCGDRLYTYRNSDIPGWSFGCWGHS